MLVDSYVSDLSRISHFWIKDLMFPIYDQLYIYKNICTY